MPDLCSAPGCIYGWIGRGSYHYPEFCPSCNADGSIDLDSTPRHREYSAVEAALALHRHTTGSARESLAPDVVDEMALWLDYRLVTWKATLRDRGIESWPLFDNCVERLIRLAVNDYRRFQSKECAVVWCKSPTASGVALCPSHERQNHIGSLEATDA